MLNTMNKQKLKSRFLSGKKIFLFLAGTALVAAAGCGGKTEDGGNADVPKGMVAADLSAQGLAVLVNVPDSTVAPLEITENSQGGADVKVGKNFQITIVEGPGDMTLKKADVTGDAVRKFIKYVSEDEHAIVWEWQIDNAEPTFHFYAIVKAGDKTFEVREVEGENFSEKAAVQMLDAAKSIRLKAPAKPAA